MKKLSDTNSYKLKKQRRKNKIYLKLSENGILDNKEDRRIKNIFRLKLRQWHDLLSGGGTTGDPALDDIMSIMMICYLQNKLELYDFKNLKHYKNNKSYKKYFRYLDINELLKDSDALIPIDNSKSSIEKLGELLMNGTSLLR